VASRFALVLVSVGGVKAVAASFGHDVADDVLRTMASRLRASVPDGGLVARVSGDTFAFVLPDGSAEQAAAQAESLVHQLSDAVHANGTRGVLDHALPVHVHVGVALWPDAATSTDALLAAGEEALHLAQQAGANEYRFYSAEAQVVAREQLAIEAALRDALEHGGPGLAVAYQPQYDVERGALRGVEALLRFTHPTLGAISPERVVAVADATGLIHQLGRFVLSTACRDAVAWRAANPAFVVAVNVSARQLGDPDFTARVLAALRDTGLPADALELEMTESAFVETDDAAPRLAALRAHGVDIAIDDFGTGWSSLAYLARLPVDTVKVDRAFVAALPGDAAGETVVRAIVALAHELGLAVVAEGVETVAQLARLREYGCDSFQGFLVCRPVPAVEVTPRAAAGVLRDATA
jgi:diguanylate cyclase (GGDEF)-like protein